MKWNFAILLLGIAIVAVIPSSESLWTDEAITAEYTYPESIVDFAEKFSKERRSESQMPLYVLFVFAFSELLGNSEWELRAPNILWGAIAMVAMAICGRAIGLPALPLLLGIAPFFWFYVDEARGYAMQIAFASWLLAGWLLLLRDGPDNRWWAPLLGLSAFLLCATSMLGIFTVAAVFSLAIPLLLKSELRQIRGKIALIVSLALLGALGAYYLSTLLGGSGGAKLWSVGIGNIAFAAYEIMGTLGAGASRSEIRELAKTSDWAAIFQNIAPAFLLCIGLHGALLAFVGKSWRVANQRSALVFSIAVVILSTLLLLCAAYAFKWPFWGRHLAPVFPFYLLAIGLLMKFALSTRSVFGTSVVVLFISFWIFSSLNLRFNEKHARTDYRSAAKHIQKHAASLDVVWWAGGNAALDYYLIKELSRRDISMHWVNGLSIDELELQPLPQWIVVSNYDSVNLEAILDYTSQASMEKTATFADISIYSR